MWEIHLRNIQSRYKVASPMGQLSVVENSSVTSSLDESSAMNKNEAPSVINEQVTNCKLLQNHEFCFKPRVFMRVMLFPWLGPFDTHYNDGAHNIHYY